MKQKTKMDKDQFAASKQFKKLKQESEGMSEASQLDQLESMNFDKAIPGIGGNNGKPDKDEMDML